MNLAYRDIKHNLLRFVLTTFGLSLLLGVVIVITGVYRGMIDDGFPYRKHTKVEARR